MPGLKCGGCGRFTSSQEGVRCGKCQAHYHRACVGITPKAAVSNSWRCPECTKGVVRDNRADTPVRGATESSVKKSVEQVCTPVITAVGSKPVSPVTPPRDSSAEIEPLLTAPDASLILEELRAMRADLQLFRKDMELEMAGLRASMNACSARVDRLEARLDALEQRASDLPRPGAVDGIVEDLKHILRDQFDADLNMIPWSTLGGDPAV
ncbi:hypothetical protein PYW08_012982 [Mythimna loreyi]|uniref:Uncharacterized protein n=1 Tax=Mythimna loreyi TaxID=667449 RepID=A0ACC2PYS3_9NEOP|nr:hypothetical protein PYW08_012982 [Mythimna loreyi]